MRFSVCVPAVLGGMPLADALAKVKGAGADTFEIWGWEPSDLPVLQAGMQAHGLKMAAMCTKLVPLNDPARREEFLSGLRESIAAAKTLSCPVLIAQAGQTLDGMPLSGQHACIAEGLREAAPLLEEAGIVLALEPLNDLVDHKGYCLTRSSDAYAIIRSVNSPCVKVLFDIYHQQITEGNLIANLREGADCIAHVHAAGVPGRHEIHRNCEINYPAVFAALADMGYAGAVGLEYFPTEDPVEGIRAALHSQG